MHRPWEPRGLCPAGLPADWWEEPQPRLGPGCGGPLARVSEWDAGHLRLSRGTEGRLVGNARTIGITDAVEVTGWDSRDPGNRTDNKTRSRDFQFSD